MTPITIALLVLRAVLAQTAATHTIPNAPASWELDGSAPEAGEIQIRCWRATAVVACATLDVVVPGYGCVGAEDAIVGWVRAPATEAGLRASYPSRERSGAAIVEDGLTEIACNTLPLANPRIAGLYPRASVWPTCLAGTVTGPTHEGRQRDGSAWPVEAWVGRCCWIGCACQAGGSCLSTPPTEVAGHEVGHRRVCAAVPGAPGCSGP